MAYYPYVSIVKEAHNALGSSVTFDQLDGGRQRQLHDIAIDIVLRGGATTPFEKNVEEIANKRRVAKQALEDPAPKVAVSLDPRPQPLSTAEKQEIERRGVGVLVNAGGVVTPVGAVAEVGFGKVDPLPTPKPSAKK